MLKYEFVNVQNANETKKRGLTGMKISLFLSSQVSLGRKKEKPFFGSS
jgi:hypothetical protein